MTERQLPCGLSPLFDRFRQSEDPIATAQKHFNSSYFENLHFHDFPQLWYCADGKYEHVVGDDTYICESGSLIIVPPGVPHLFNVEEASTRELFQINVNFSIFKNFSEISELACAAFLFLNRFGKELKFPFCTKYDFKGEEKQTADAVFRKLAKLDGSNLPKNTSLYTNLFFSVFALSPFELPEKVRIRAERFIREKYVPLLRTVYYININYGSKITREELVSMSGLCQTDYFRYIKRIVGETFSSYLQRIRVRHAVILATFSPYSLSYIADICGFGDLTYMENRIKKFSSTLKLPRDMRRERKKYIQTFPKMIMSRADYEKLPKFFYYL